MSYFEDVDPDVRKVIEGLILATPLPGLNGTPAENIILDYFSNRITSLDCANQLAALSDQSES